MECVLGRKGLDKLHGNTHPGIIQISDLSNHQNVLFAVPSVV